MVVSLLLAAAMAQDVPYYNRGVEKDQDIGGLGQNFRDLADRNLEAVGGSGIPGDKCFDNPTLCVDATNHRVGIGTSLPSSVLDVSGGGIGSWCRTKAQIDTLVPGRAGEEICCSDCTVPYTKCNSTGTLASQYRVQSATTTTPGIGTPNGCGTGNWWTDTR